MSFFPHPLVHAYSFREAIARLPQGLGDAPVCLTPLLPSDLHARLARARVLVADLDHALRDRMRPPDEQARPIPSDPFGRPSSEWWSERRVRSDVFDPLDAKLLDDVNTMVERRVHRHAVIDLAGHIEPPLPGTSDLFAHFEDRCVISTFVDEAIEEYLIRHKLNAKVAATTLVYADGIVASYMPDTIPSGKRVQEAIRRYLATFSHAAPETLVLGGCRSGEELFSLPTANVVHLRPAELYGEIDRRPGTSVLSSAWSHLSLVVISESLDAVLDAVVSSTIPL